MKKRSRLINAASDNRFHVKFMQLEIGLLIDPGGGFQCRLFGEVEAETDKVCSGSEIEFTHKRRNTDFAPNMESY